MSCGNVLTWSPVDRVRMVLESCSSVVGWKGTMGIMASRKQHSAEEIVRKLRRAD